MMTGMMRGVSAIRLPGAPRRWLVRRIRILVALCIVLAAFIAGVAAPLDAALASARFSLIQRPDSGTLAVVGIDPPSLEAAGSWPWPRERYARAIHNLRTAGAQLIGFDVDFSASSTQGDDKALQAAIDAEAGWIVLPTFVQRDSKYENTPLASIAENALIGSVNVLLDPDGKVRNYARGYLHGDHYHPTIGAILSSAPYGDNSLFLIDYGISADRIPQLSFDDILNNRFDPALVKGRNILIGAIASELGDEYSTPTRTAFAGVLVHALAYESLVQARALVAPDGLIMLGAAIITLMLLWPRRGPVNFLRLLRRHAAVASFFVLVPLAIQALAPVSIDAGICFFAQALCLAETIRKELAFRRREITRQREEHLQYIALHDPETLLPNRRAMQDELGRRLAERGEKACLAIAIGIDRFHTLRGAIGYTSANRLVSELAGRISALEDSLRVFHLSTSILGILDESDDPSAGILRWRERIAALNTQIDVDGQHIDVVLRSGLASTHTSGEAPERILERATIALDLARLRKAEVIVDAAEASMDPRLQLAIVGGAQRGLEAGQFRLVYQPKVTARGFEITGAEALVRWQHPEFGAISPALFIGIMEETGVIDVLSRWILAQAIADQAELRAQGMDIPFSVNLSARLLSDTTFCDYAVDLVRSSGASICMEITETAMLDNPAAAFVAIDRLREAGMSMSIDDYGAGLSSLSYLKQIPADELKIDRSLIIDVTRSVRDRMIIKSTTDLAHSLGMKVTAEGVEDAETCAVLASLGCDSLQGYHVARPGPLSDLRSWAPVRSEAVAPAMNAVSLAALPGR